MREIKFRGKPMNGLDRRPWVYGYYANWKQDSCMTEFISAGNMIDMEGWIEIKGGTIGQYTGLKDKNGKEIYEGDIVKYGYDEPREIEQVRWGSFADCCVGGETWILGPDAYQKGAIWQPAIWYHWDDNPAENTIEVIGNIYENPELLKGEK
jgi:uncharacterized phage protein (TIGR01671 family)